MSDVTDQGKRTRAARRRNAGPTIADVARAAGVSPMTVSRVINNDAAVVAATREKVERAVATLGYVPNPAARSLAGGRQCRIALLHSNPSAAYLSEFLVGSLAGAAERDAQIVIEHWNGEEDAAALARRLSAHRIDAVLLPPPLCEDNALLEALAAVTIPTAQVATGRPSPIAHAVTIDDEAAAHAITAHLIGLGHHRIGFITGSGNQTASALRAAGHARALREAGIDADPALLVSGDYTYRSGLAAAGQLLDLAPAPTAIFASNDDMAAAVVAVAHRRHLDVPADLSVCGFDDTAMATTIWPELTTIRQPIADMAKAAALLLVEAVAAGRTATTLPAMHRRLSFALIARKSDGPPPKAVA